MYIWFILSLSCVFVVLPFYFLSVEHLKLRKRYGEEKGARIGGVLGVVSGWGFFLSWFGVWVSPQPRFVFPVFQDLAVSVGNFSFPVVHLVIFAPFFVVGAWFGIEGVRETSLKVAETHRTERIVTNGVYSVVRHPQYFGGLLAHFGVSFLFSAWYSLVSTPLMVGIVFLISWKEERELVKEFGKEYEDYRKAVPMLMPKLR